MLIEEEITNKILAAAFKVHSELGPGLLESAYKECLCYQMMQDGLKVEKEKSVPLFYDGIKLDLEYRLDIMVQDKIVIETKAVKELDDVHMAQILTYLRLSNCEVGLLLNFKVVSLKNGIKRVYLKKREPLS